MPHPTPNTLRKRFEAEQKAYNQIRLQAEKRVVRSEYWSDFRWHWDPSDSLIEHLENASHWRRNPPRKTDKSQAYYTYGFDKAERVVVIREGMPGESDPDEEHFIRYSGAEFQVSVFYSGSLTNSATGTTLNGKTARIDQVCPGQKAWKEIYWQDDSPVRVVFGEAGATKADLEWEFAKAGKLVGMYDLPRKLPKGVNLATLKKQITKHLLTVIPKTVAKLRIKQPAYCLILGYDGEGNGAMPPMLSVGLDSERQLFLSKAGKKAKHMIWNPDEFHHRLSKPRCLPADKKFEKACELFNQRLADRESDGPAVDLLNQVAKKLGVTDWFKVLPVTDDFVVVATDFEGGGVSKNIRKSAPSKVLKSLEARNLV